MKMDVGHLARNLGELTREPLANNLESLVKSVQSVSVKAISQYGNMLGKDRGKEEITHPLNSMIL